MVELKRDVPADRLTTEHTGAGISQLPPVGSDDEGLRKAGPRKTTEEHVPQKLPLKHLPKLA